MWHFLINSTACLFFLWLFYKIALENISWHNFKRVYLLTSIAISFIIPFIVVKTIVLPFEGSIVNAEIDQSMPAATTFESSHQLQYIHLLIGLYVIGTFIMFRRFLKNLKHFKLKDDDKVETLGKYVLILRNEPTVPHSFFNCIILNKSDHECNRIAPVVYVHEKAHLDQKHSLDILFIELLIVLFWFNPLLYMYRYSIKLNHEFLADRTVLNNGVSTAMYQKLIFDYTSTGYRHSIANTFHFPLIKKRFNIMRTKTSIRNGLLRSLAIVPLLALLVLSCGQEAVEYEEMDVVIEEELPLESKGNTTQQKTIIIANNLTKGNIKIDGSDYSYNKEKDGYKFYDRFGNPFDYKKEGYELIEVVEVLEDLTPGDIEEYNRLAKKHKVYMEENNTVIAWKEATWRMQTIYNSMNKKQRSENEPWPYTGTHYGIYYGDGDIPPPPPPPTEAQTPPPPPPPAEE